MILSGRDGSGRRFTRAGMTSLAAVTVAALLAACGTSGGSSSNSASNQYKLLTAGVISAATDRTEEPTAFLQNGQYTGFAVQLGQDIAKRLGLKVTFKGVDFNSVISQVSTNQYDIGLLGILDTPPRDKLVSFSKPVYYGFYGCVSQKSAHISGLASLKGKSVAVLQGSAEATYLQQNYPGIVLKTYSDWAGTINAVVANQVDAVLTGSADIPSYLKQHPNLTMSCTVPVPTPNAFPIPKQDTALLNAVNTQLNSIFMDGTYAKLYHKWYPGDPIAQQLLKQHPGMPQ